MEHNNFFAITRSAAISGSIVVLLLLAVSEMSNILFEEPKYSDYVTEQNEASPLYKEQRKAYQQAKDQSEPERFAFKMGNGLLMLAAGIFLPVAAVGTPLVIAGSLETSFAFLLHMHAVSGLIRFLCFLLVLIPLFFFLYRWGKKRP